MSLPDETMNVSIGASQDRGSTSVTNEALATAGTVAVADQATSVAVAGATGGATKVAQLAASARPAIMRAVRGTLDRNCGIAAVPRAPEDGHQSRQARRDSPPGAVAKTGLSGDRTPCPSPIAAWIALRGGFTG
jgi:hypothetical protein